MGKKSSKTTSKTEPWAPAKDDILGSIGTVRDTVGDNQGYLDSIAGDIRGFLPQLGQQAFGPNAMLQAGNQYATDVLGGKYLNSNQYLDGMIGQTANDVTDRVNALFGKSGASLGTQHAGVLTRELANAENTMRYGNYAQERQNQMGAAGLLPALNQAQYAGVTPYLAAAQTAGQLPFAGIGALSPIIGLAGGSGTSTSTQKDGLLKTLMDAGASAAAAYAQSGSDPRLKENIQKVGDLAPGVGIYEWDYRQDLGFELPEGRYRGFMAPEIAAVAPWMIGTPMHGYMTVRYTPERVG